MKKALLVASVLFVALGSALAAAGAGDSPLSIDQCASWRAAITGRCTRTIRC